MFEAIFRILPDWLLAFIAACFLWFGLHYLFLTNWIVDRAGGMHAAQLARDTKDAPYLSTLFYCLSAASRRAVSDNKMEFTIYTSTFGLASQYDDITELLDRYANVSKCK